MCALPVPPEPTPGRPPTSETADGPSRPPLPRGMPAIDGHAADALRPPPRRSGFSRAAPPPDPLRQRALWGAAGSCARSCAQVYTRPPCQSRGAHGLATRNPRRIPAPRALGRLGSPRDEVARAISSRPVLDEGWIEPREGLAALAAARLSLVWRKSGGEGRAPGSGDPGACGTLPDAALDRSTVACQPNDR